ncbi:DUF5615 family PIN-like protein [Microcoleus sp. PH2017_20_SFW_D_A]|uniref:DUF5615 family PIN-like protein n=1 Tax=Microcoleus sp. PH2017_20_SFW_D_A TaxID=2798831 RepID=UPI001D568269|nr:DUF5615 family PIN-like protein [Microcoleus sp. PH2017_20_SFW_D_A]MCC3522968.1 DUF5615 family PIN-like protein [Microcoleus sp. PH2017_20_SFW_D_A]
MKLLLDENLSDGIIHRIIDLYPDSAHVKTLALTNTDDSIIWEYARANNFVIVSKDSDFHQRSLLYGHPPKFIYLRIGNSPTSKIVQILRDNFDIIIQFWNSEPFPTYSLNPRVTPTSFSTDNPIDFHHFKGR